MSSVKKDRDPVEGGSGRRSAAKLHGFGIPRLQELSFLEVTARAVGEGAGFEEIRKRQLEHMIALREANATTGNVATYRMARENPGRYVRNVTEALKELMRIGFVLRAAVPSSASAARAYQNTTFALSDSGAAWVEQLRQDPRAGYDLLLQLLWRAHPQFAGYIRALAGRGVVVPLAQWGEMPEPRTKERYIDFLVARIASTTNPEATGWSAPESEVRDALVGYVQSIAEGAESRGRADAFPRNQDFVRTCEEALVKLALERCGLSVDYISYEILRRWAKELGIANFSYYVPGLTGLYCWPTATIEEYEDEVQVSRHGGEEMRDRVVKLLGSAYERVRRDDPAHSMWVPIYRVRAAVCWRLRIADAVFDRAVVEFLRGERGGGAPFRINLDPAQYGTVPPTELPLRVPRPGGMHTYYCINLVPQQRGTELSTTTES